MKNEPRSKYTDKDLCQLSEAILWNKYFDTFNFYFAKPINEIFAEVSTPDTILFKDLQRYDDDREFLKRYYSREEYPAKYATLSEFYHSHNVSARPNLSIHDQNKIILKRNLRLHKLFVNKLPAFKDIPQTARAYNPMSKRKQRELMSSDEESEQEDANDANREGGIGEVLNKPEPNDNQSYESKVYDIYNPGDSSVASENPSVKLSSRRAKGHRNILPEEVLNDNQQDDFCPPINKWTEKSITLNSLGRLDHSNSSRPDVNESDYIMFENFAQDGQSVNLMQAGNGNGIQVEGRMPLTKKAGSKNNIMPPLKLDQLKESPVLMTNSPSGKALEIHRNFQKNQGEHRATLPCIDRNALKNEADIEQVKNERMVQSISHLKGTQPVQPAYKKGEFNIGVKSKHQMIQSLPDGNFQANTQSHEAILFWQRNPSSPTAGTKNTHSIVSTDTGNNFSRGEAPQHLQPAQNRASYDIINEKREVSGQPPLKKVHSDPADSTKLYGKNQHFVKSPGPSKGNTGTYDHANSPRYLNTKLVTPIGFTSPASKSVKSFGNANFRAVPPQKKSGGVLSPRGNESESKPSVDFKESIIVMNTTGTPTSRKGSHLLPDYSIKNSPSARVKQFVVNKHALGEQRDLKLSANRGNAHNFIIDQTKSPKNISKMALSERKQQTGPEHELSISARGINSEKKSVIIKKTVDLKLNLSKVNQVQKQLMNQKDIHGFYTERAGKHNTEPLYQTPKNSHKPSHHDYFGGESSRKNPQVKKAEVHRVEKRDLRSLNQNFNTNSDSNLGLKSDFSASGLRGAGNLSSIRVNTDHSDDKGYQVKYFSKGVNDKVKFIRQISGNHSHK